MPFRGKSAVFAQGGMSSFRPNSLRDNYVSEQSGLRRHVYNLAPDIFSAGSPAILPTGEYFGFMLARFRRTFSATLNDVEPTATASNNFQTPNVMNGSRIMQMNSKITLVNTSATAPAILDVYRMALSYYDSLVWNTLLPGSCLVSMDTTSVGPPDLRGFVTPKTPVSTLLSYNNVSSFKFIQHYLEPMGTVTIPNADGAMNQIELLINDIPPKCRRSQTGMFYAYVFHNDSTKNNSASLNLTATLDHSFTEIPSNNRLPFIE